MNDEFKSYKPGLIKSLKHARLTAMINGISLLKIPLLAFASPKVMRLDEQTSTVRVNLNWRTRNHLGSMYFGAMAMGAELSIALQAVEEIRKSKAKINFIFKDFKAEFLKRADDDVHFISKDVPAIKALIHDALNSAERFEKTYKGYAILPNVSKDEVIMRYELTLSVKKSGH